MIIKKSSLDTFLIMLVMFVVVLPILIAKKLLLLAIFVLFIRIFISEDFFLHLQKKIIIVILLMPGITGAILMAPEHLIRFSGILMIVIGFPFSTFKIKNTSILILSSLIIFYLSITQILLLQGNQLIINFREFAYNFEGIDAHKNYGTTDNIFRNAFDFSYQKIRGGGLYSNPNTLAAISLFYFFIYDITWKNFNQIINRNLKKWEIFFNSLVFIATLNVLMQSKSKTFIIGFVIYLITSNFDLVSFVKLKFKKIFFILFLFVFGILILLLDKIILSFLQGGGSGNIKYTILFDYLENASIFNLLFGGTYNVWFDTEYGYWIGATGFFGLVAFFVIYRIFYNFSVKTRPLLITFLFTSIGTSLFYSLLYVSILIPLFIILLSTAKRIN